MEYPGGVILAFVLWIQAEDVHELIEQTPKITPDHGARIVLEPSVLTRGRKANGNK